MTLVDERAGVKRVIGKMHPAVNYTIVYTTKPRPTYRPELVQEWQMASKLLVAIGTSVLRSCTVGRSGYRLLYFDNMGHS